MPRPLAALLLMVSLAFIGCAAPEPVGAGPDAAPPDFALVFTVTTGTLRDAADDAASDPLLRPAQHIVTPDRVLRVAFGAGVHPGLFPPATATLSPVQVDRLWRVIREAGLTRPQPAATTGPIYTIHLTATGRQTRYVTSADACPPATELLRELARLRGDRLEATPLSP